MVKNTTARGFDLIKFKDSYGKKCSLQKSSAALENCIWLGLGEIGARMHLTMEMVRDLLPHLKKFANEGDI